MKNNVFLQGIILLLMVTFFWGAAFPIAKGALSTLDGFYLTLMRYGVASLVLISILALIEGKAAFSLEGKGKKLLLRSVPAFTGFNLLAFIGLSYSTSIHVSIIMALLPLVTVILHWITKGIKPSAVTLICIFSAVIGVLLVVTKGYWHSFAISSNYLFGDALALIGVLCWSIYTLSASEFSSWSSLRYTAISITLSTLFIALVTLMATWGSYAHVPSLSLIWSNKYALIYLSLISGVIAMMSWNHGIRKLGPLNGVLFMNLVPIFALMIGLLLGQTISRIEMAGFGLTLLALVINNTYSRLSRT